MKEKVSCYVIFRWFIIRTDKPPVFEKEVQTINLSSG